MWFKSYISLKLTLEQVRFFVTECNTVAFYGFMQNRATILITLVIIVAVMAQRPTVPTAGKRALITKSGSISRAGTSAFHSDIITVLNQFLPATAPSAHDRECKFLWVKFLEISGAVRDFFMKQDYRWDFLYDGKRLWNLTSTDAVSKFIGVPELYCVWNTLCSTFDKYMYTIFTHTTTFRNFFLGFQWAGAV